MIEKPAITDQPIEKIIAERWSGRAFDNAMPVTEEKITAMLEAARWSPSCYGEQPWRFLICDRDTHPDAWNKALDTLSAGNQEWAKNAPLLVVASAVPHFTHNDKPNRWNGYDTGAASMSFCLQATALGLMSHQMGGFDADKLRAAFEIPSDIELWAVIAIGYPAPLDDLTDEQMERELKARERRPLEQLFYRGTWQN